MKFLDIQVVDKNDNSPYFERNLYEAEVDENEDIGHTVLVLNANDKDECEYDIFLDICFQFFYCCVISSIFSNKNKFSLTQCLMVGIITIECFLEKSYFSHFLNIQLQDSVTKSRAGILEEHFLWIKQLGQSVWLGPLTMKLMKK